jgi:hypothetical protein
VHVIGVQERDLLIRGISDRGYRQGKHNDESENDGNPSFSHTLPPKND